jgi:hypothetical protein
MKKSAIAVTLFSAALLFSSGAIAGEGNKGTLHLDSSVSVEGKKIDAGTYKVEWTGSGSDVQVTLLRGKNTVATFPAHVTEQANANAGDAYGTAAQPDGTRTLTAIYLGGKKTVLEIGQNGTSQQSSNQGGN